MSSIDLQIAWAPAVALNYVIPVISDFKETVAPAARGQAAFPAPQPVLANAPEPVD
ncbi:MAG TPA: hypothetical protein VGH99_11895 [Pseudonocardia sp.]|jgi:hypothetical protein